MANGYSHKANEVTVTVPLLILYSMNISWNNEYYYVFLWYLSTKTHFFVFFPCKTGFTNIFLFISVWFLCVFQSDGELESMCSLAVSQRTPWSTGSSWSVLGAAFCHSAKSFGWKLCSSKNELRMMSWAHTSLHSPQSYLNCSINLH